MVKGDFRGDFKRNKLAPFEGYERVTQLQMFCETTSLSNPLLHILQKEKIASLNCANTSKKIPRFHDSMIPRFQDSKFQIPCFTAYHL